MNGASYPDLQSSLDKIRTTLGITHKEFAGHLQLSQKAYKDVRDLRRDLPINSAIALAEQFNFSLGSLWSGQIDYSALLAAKKGEVNYIPARYLVAPFSRYQTARVMIDFLQKAYGSYAVASVFRHFQMNPKVFQGENGWINNVFFTDLLHFLEKHFGARPGIYYRMGCNSTAVNYSSELGQAYRALPSIASAYENFFGELLPHYERNTNCTILSLDSERCLMQTRAKKDVAEALSLRHLGNHAICEWKTGVFASIPGYFGTKNAVVKELSCVHDGAANCIFEILYDHLK